MELGKQCQKMVSCFLLNFVHNLWKMNLEVLKIKMWLSSVDSWTFVCDNLAISPPSSGRPCLARIMWLKIWYFLGLEPLQFKNRTYEASVAGNGLSEQLAKNNTVNRMKNCLFIKRIGIGALSAIIFIKVYRSEVRGILRFMKGCQTGKVVHLYLFLFIYAHRIDSGWCSIVFCLLNQKITEPWNQWTHAFTENNEEQCPKEIVGFLIILFVKALL